MLIAVHTLETAHELLGAVDSIAFPYAFRLFASCILWQYYIYTGSGLLTSSF